MTSSSRSLVALARGTRAWVRDRLAVARAPISAAVRHGCGPEGSLTRAAGGSCTPCARYSTTCPAAMDRERKRGGGGRRRRRTCGEAVVECRGLASRPLQLARGVKGMQAGGSCQASSAWFVGLLTSKPCCPPRRWGAARAGMIHRSSMRDQPTCTTAKRCMCARACLLAWLRHNLHAPPCSRESSTQACAAHRARGPVSRSRVCLPSCMRMCPDAASAPARYLGMHACHFQHSPPAGPTPSALNRHPCTLNPRPSTLDPKPSTLDPQPSTLTPRPSTQMQRRAGWGRLWYRAGWGRIFLFTPLHDSLYIRYMRYIRYIRYILYMRYIRCQTLTPYPSTLKPETLNCTRTPRRAGLTPPLSARPRRFGCRLRAARRR